jgi:glycosyltransferase involved in cell wall biosynthesis
LLPSLGVPYVLDFDDAIYLSNTSDANRGLAKLKFAGKTAIIARHAELVVVGNEYLAGWAAQHAARVDVIPTTVDTVTYTPRRAVRDRDRDVCIGWSGSVTTARYLDAITPVLRDLQRRYGVRIRVIGDEEYRISGADVDAIRWQANSEVEDLQEIDIGVMPLPDDEWARGKCGLKALQYMALGIPTVMSPVGVNRKIASGGSAWLAESTEDWSRALTELILDSRLRDTLGRKGRERVEHEYSADVAAPRWAEALRSVASSRGAARG